MGIGCSPDSKLKVQENTNGENVAFALRAFNDSGAGRTALFTVDPDAQTLTLGTSNIVNDISNERIGIGTASPSEPLHVYESGDGITLLESTGHTQLTIKTTGTTDHTELNFGDSGDDDRGAIRYSHGSTDAMQFDTAAIERMRLTSTGNLCVGPSGSSAGFTPALTVTGTNPSLGLRLQDGNSGTFFNTILSADGNSIKAMYSQAYSFATAANDGGTSENARFTLDTSGNVSIDGNLSEGSDIRLKTNIEKIPDVLDVLNEIKPVKFEWKEDVEEGIEKKHIGLIAQEVEPHFPELIYEGTTRDTDDETYKGLNYAGLTPILLKSIQELSSKVNELQQKIENIKKTCKCMKEE